jgi:hypothetical protein
VAATNAFLARHCESIRKCRRLDRILVEQRDRAVADVGERVLDESIDGGDVAG